MVRSMKKALFILFLISILVLSSMAFVGCDSVPEPTQTEATEKATGPLDDTMFNIYYKHKYLCAFVSPEAPTEIESLIIDELKSTIMKQTGVAVSFINDSESIDGYESVILIGNTKYQESKDAYAVLGENRATAEVKNEKLVVAFSSLSGGKGIIKLLSRRMSNNNFGEIRIELDYSEIYDTISQEDNFPVFKHADKNIDCGEDTYMRYFEDVLPVEFDSYCEEIQTAGFSKLYSREKNGNLFATFANDSIYAYVYYTAHSNDIRIITGPVETLALADYTADVEIESESYIASIPQPKDGQGYILRLPDGRYLIHDGGYEGDDRVYKALRNLQPEGDITIAAWFISHPHSDHYAAFIDFIRDHGKDESIVIERLIHNYIHHESYNINGSAGLDMLGESVQKLYSSIDEYAPDLTVIKAHTGQVISFGDAEVEILFTVEDILPASLTNNNDSSMVIRVCMSGNSIMLLADTCYASGPKLNNIWGDYLKSDIVQVAHHGMWPSVADIYHSIQGEVVLFSAMYTGVNYYIKDNTGWEDVMQVVLEYAKDIYVSDAQGEVIMLPYIAKNNKEAQLEYIKNR